MTTLALHATPALTERLTAAQPVDQTSRWHSIEVILGADLPPSGPNDPWHAIDLRRTPIASVTLAPGSRGQTLVTRTPSAWQEAVHRIAMAGQWALRYRCRHVLLEVGRIEVPDVERVDEESLDALEGLALGEERRTEIQALRTRLAPLHLDALCRALHALGQALPEVVWCLGPAPTPLGVPDADEIELVLEDLNRSEARLAYWHRTGICHRRERLGLEPAESWLGRFGAQTAAVRLDDAQGRSTGHLPGTGEVDFSGIAPALPRTAIRSVYWPEESTPLDLVEAYRFLQNGRLLGL